MLLRRTSSSFVGSWRPTASLGLPAACTYATKMGEGVAVPSLLLNKTVGQLLAAQRDKHEHKDVLVLPHQRLRWTHVELDKYVRAWGNGLADARVRRKPAPALPDRVLSYLPDNAENITTLLGTGVAGRIVVSASPESTASPAQVHEALKTLEARVIVLPPKYNGHNNIQLMNELDEEIPTWPEQVALNLRTYPTLKLIANTGDRYHQGHIMWKQLMLYDPTPSLLPPSDAISPDETFIGYFTPAEKKTTLYSHSAIVNGGAMLGTSLGLTSSDRMCVASPLHTPHGLQALLAGVAHAAVVIVPSASFDAEQVLGSLERDACTLLHLSPQQLQAVLDSPLFLKHNLSALQKVVLVGPARESSSGLVQLVERATRDLKGVKDIVVAFTTDDVAGAFLTGSATQNASNPGACRLLPHVEGKIMAGGKPVKATGTTGRLFVRGFPVTKGHWAGAAGTQPSTVVDGEGWLDTGIDATSAGDVFTIKH